MANGKTESLDRLNWNHTANLIAEMRNLMRGKDDEVVDPRQINPYTADTFVKKRVKAPFSVLKNLLNVRMKPRPRNG